MPLSRINLLLLVMLGLAAFGCRTGNKEGSSPPSAPEILEGSAAAFEGVNTFHFLLEHENGATPILFDLLMERAEGDVVKPDRMQAEVTARLRGITARSKVVSIGDRGWMTNPFTQTYQALPSGTTVQQMFDPKLGVRQIVQSIQDPRISGSEKVDGVDCYVIDGTTDSVALRPVAPVAESGFTVKVRAHIGKSDLLPRRVRLEGPLLQTEQPAIVRKVSLSQFNENVSIEPPQ